MAVEAQQAAGELVSAAVRQPIRRRRKLGWWLLVLEALVAYAFLYVPILILVIYSFNASKINAVWRGFTLDWYRSLFAGGGVLGLYGQGAEAEALKFQGAGILQALKNSLIVATSATAIATVIGTMIALAMDRFRFRLRGVFDVILYLPIVIPDITMGISLLVFFSLVFKLLENLLGVRAALGFPTIIVSHVAFNISFVAIVVRARLAGLDRSLEEAAQDLGANHWQTFRRVTLPLIMPGVLGGALLAFTLSLDDFVITFFTSGVGSSTLPLFVYGMIRFTVTPAINAISTLMLLASMVLVMASLALQRK
jgi:spermidine/putrescine transport system permease protein